MVFDFIKGYLEKRKRYIETQDRKDRYDRDHSWQQIPDIPKWVHKIIDPMSLHDSVIEIKGKTLIYKIKCVNHGQGFDEFYYYKRLRHHIKEKR
jgi:hypothetical protein